MWLKFSNNKVKLKYLKGFTLQYNLPVVGHPLCICSSSLYILDISTRYICFSDIEHKKDKSLLVLFWCVETITCPGPLTLQSAFCQRSLYPILFPFFLFIAPSSISTIHTGCNLRIMLCCNTFIFGISYNTTGVLDNLSY